MDTINEGTTAYLTITFRDRNGSLAVPSSVTWEAHDIPSGEELQEATVLTPASSIEITIPASVNVFQDETRLRELRRITIEAGYGADDYVRAHFDYHILNLSEV